MKEKTKKRSAGYFGQFLIVLRNTNIPWLWVAISFLFNAASNVMLLKIPTLSASLMAGNLSGQALRDGILFFVLYAVVICSQTTVLAIAGCLATKNARNRLWNKMLNIRMDYYDQNDPGELMSAVTNDLSSAMPQLVNLIVTVIPDIWFLVQAMTEVSGYNLLLLLSVLAFLPIKYIYMLILGRRAYKVKVGIFTEIGGLTGFLAERINNLALIKSFAKEDQERENGEEVSKRLFRANMREYKLGAVSDAINTLITLGQQFLILITAVILLQQGKITMSQWVAFFLFSQNITLKFDTLVNDWLYIKFVQGTIARTAELLTAPEENVEETGPSSPSGPAGEIVFDHVSFSYGDKQALSDVSFTVPQGSVAAIVGLCGSGKTTSLSLLERFYSPQQGEIRLGGKPVEQMSLAEYRSHFAYVQQNPEVFSGTAREALTYGIRREVSDEEIWQAARASGFAEYLEQQPQGLETPVSAGGNSMSGGQRQRLVLTREFLRSSEILLLDEPTSALDAETAAMVQQAIFTLFKGKTVLIVTHDMHLLEGMNQIIVLEESRLVGCGSYDELMESCPLFREMILTQAGGGEVPV